MNSEISIILAEFSRLKIIAHHIVVIRLIGKMIILQCNKLKECLEAIYISRFPSFWREKSPI